MRMLIQQNNSAEKQHSKAKSHIIQTGKINLKACLYTHTVEQHARTSPFKLMNRQLYLESRYTIAAHSS